MSNIRRLITKGKHAQRMLEKLEQKPWSKLWEEAETLREENEALVAEIQRLRQERHSN